jgi:hypothetical protein
VEAKAMADEERATSKLFVELARFADPASMQSTRERGKKKQNA